MPQCLGPYCLCLVGKAPEKRASFRAGMTLIELMIVVLISMIVLGAAFTLYQVNARYYVAQDALLEQQQNLRSALYSIGRDVRMAGNGMNLMNAKRVNVYIRNGAFGQQMGINPNGGWFTYRGAAKAGVRTIFGEDGQAGGDTTLNGSDTLTVFYASIESASPLGTLAGDYTPGTTAQITLNEDLVNNALVNGDMVAVAAGNDVVVVEAVNVTTGAGSNFAVGPRFQPKANLPGTNFSSGSNVYRLRDVTLVTYFLGDNDCLMANYYDFTEGLADDEESQYGETGGPVVLANDIEDFQVRYMLDDQPQTGAKLDAIQAEDELSEGRLDNEGRTVRAVQLAIVSKSEVPSDTTSPGHPMSVFNHNVNAVADGFQRRVLTDTIYLRNF